MTENVAESVINAFGGQTSMSRALNGVPISTIDSWKRAGNIPSWRRADVVEAAKREGVALPPAFLAEMPSAPKPTGPAPEDLTERGPCGENSSPDSDTGTDSPAKLDGDTGRPIPATEAAR